jgi:hypothetical protein
MSQKSFLFLVIFFVIVKIENSFLKQNMTWNCLWHFSVFGKCHSSIWPFLKNFRTRTMTSAWFLLLYIQCFKSCTLRPYILPFRRQKQMCLLVVRNSWVCRKFTWFVEKNIIWYVLYVNYNILMHYCQSASITWFLILHYQQAAKEPAQSVTLHLAIYITFALTLKKNYFRLPSPKHYIDSYKYTAIFWLFVFGWRTVCSYLCS